MTFRKPQQTRTPPKTVSDPLREFRFLLMCMLLVFAYLTMGKPHAAKSRAGQAATATLAADAVAAQQSSVPSR
jgi:hypothetical protein